MSARSKWFIKKLLLVLFATSPLLFFQNCGQVSFDVNDSSSIAFSAGNGNTYDGKLNGRYVRRVPDYKCNGAPSVHSEIQITSNSITHTDICSQKKTSLNMTQLKNSAFLNTVVGFEGGIYAKEETKTTLFNDSFCRYEKSAAEGIAVQVEWNRSDRTQATIHKGFLGSQGEPLKDLWGPVSIQRSESKKLISYTHDNFKLEVDLTSPVAGQFRLFKSNFQMTVDGVTESHSMDCFLGTEQDVVYGNLKVQALYPVNGSDWGQWIQADGPSKTQIGHTDSACMDVNPTNVYACYHGGEMRKVSLDGFSSCSGLFLEDDLNAFEWVCDESGPTPFFYSKKLLDTSGLTALIRPEGFRYNRVRLKSRSSGILLGSSPLFQWWSNPIMPLPDNSQPGDVAINLTVPGGIYYLAETRESMGYYLTGLGVSLVTLPGATLKAHPDLMSVVSAPNFLTLLKFVSFNWLEGDFKGVSNLQSLLKASGINHFNRVHNAKFDTCDNTILGCINLQMVQWNVFTNVEVTNSGQNGINLLNDARRNTFKNVKSHGNAMSGISLRSFSGGNPGSGNKFIDVTTVNNGVDGIALGNNSGNGNIFINLLSANNGRHGVTAGYYHNTFARTIVANNGGHGIHILKKCLECRFLGVTAINNAGHGIATENVGVEGQIINSNMKFIRVATLGNDNGTRMSHSSMTFTDFLSANNNIGEEIFDVSDNNKWTGYHITSNNNVQNCLVTTSGVNPGINGLCQNIGSSLPTLILGLDIIDDIQPKPLTCPGGACTTKDWAVVGIGSFMRNIDSPFVPGDSCPVTANGSETESYESIVGQPLHYLKLAYELVDDGIGDEDGLCESNETCVYMPNRGGYQGDGPLTNSCVFMDGADVKNVRLLSFSNN